MCGLTGGTSWAWFWREGLLSRKGDLSLIVPASAKPGSDFAKHFAFLRIHWHASLAACIPCLDSAIYKTSYQQLDGLR